MEQYCPEALALAERIGDQALMAEANNAWAIYQQSLGELGRRKLPLDERFPWRDR
jgi:hypothetical protein